MQKRRHQSNVPGYLLASAFLVLLVAACPPPSLANFIYVTTLEDTIGDPSGCSLKDAIYSSKLHLNEAVQSYDVNSHMPLIVPTVCVAGGGNDTIILPSGALLELSLPDDDSGNPTGASATALITSSITIEANGAILAWAPHCDTFLQSVCTHITAHNMRLFSVGTTGHLTLRNAFVQGFTAQGGNGTFGGGGGLGAGGAIYVQGGALRVEGSTFTGAHAIGGDGGTKGHGDSGGGGGGGGMGGAGGDTLDAFEELTGQFNDGGGGGGGSGGPGSEGNSLVFGGNGGDGGGSLANGFGFDCSGMGGQGAGLGFPPSEGSNGANAPCPGGGGGGGGIGEDIASIGTSNNGGDGNYGGGGGGGSADGGNGGNGGFGGGGGAGWSGDFSGVNGGRGGFGAGGGAAAGGIVFGSGSPGQGGMFGGRANSRLGGGGGALGGAIFNDSGIVTITNCTFSGNIVTRGNGGGQGSPGAADNGADAGAIFSVNGRLTVLNSTLSGNLGTGEQSGIVVAQTSPDIPTSFTLDNTIIYNNGGTDSGGNPVGTPKECSIVGSSVEVRGAGNLIQNNDNCAGVVTTGDPLLHPLENNRGFTPTMAINPASAAFNAADPGTSLSTDQRLTPRPEDGGFDIGAFEYCDVIRDPSCNVVGAAQTELLTLVASPPAGGTTVPAPGTVSEGQNWVVAVTAIANTGYLFMNWTGNVASATNSTTTVVMNQPQTVTANFVPCGCAMDVSGSVSVVRGPYVFNLGTQRFVQTVTLSNISPNTLTGPISLVLDSLSVDATLVSPTGLTDALFSPVGSPYVNANVALAPGQNVAITLQFTDPTKGAITYSTRVLAGPGLR
jgi:hypothetical protein